MAVHRLLTEGRLGSEHVDHLPLPSNDDAYDERPDVRDASHMVWA